jgi:hypothetical protein
MRATAPATCPVKSNYIEGDWGLSIDYDRLRGILEVLKATADPSLRLPHAMRLRGAQTRFVLDDTVGVTIGTSEVGRCSRLDWGRW